MKDDKIHTGSRRRYIPNSFGESSCRPLQWFLTTKEGSSCHRYSSECIFFVCQCGFDYPSSISTLLWLLYYYERYELVQGWGKLCYVPMAVYNVYVDVARREMKTRSYGQGAKFILNGRMWRVAYDAEKFEESDEKLQWIVSEFNITCGRRKLKERARWCFLKEWSLYSRTDFEETH